MKTVCPTTHASSSSFLRALTMVGRAGKFIR